MSQLTLGDGDGNDLRGQARVIHTVRKLVDAWRGFELGPAGEAYPDREPRYAPVLPQERPTSDTTQTLLRHWFRREPHVVRAGNAAGTALFRYWPHQRRLVETFVYLYEVRGIRRTEDLWRLAGEEPLSPQRDPWAKLGGQLATGSGKTKMMSLLIAWSTLNARIESPEHLGLGPHSLVIAPGLFVRDRLFQDFDPAHGLSAEERAAGVRSSVFFADPVVPPAFESAWDLTVYGPDDCPRHLDPERGALVVTNYHQLLRLPEGPAPVATGMAHQLGLLFGDGEPSRLEAVETPLIERFRHSRGLLVLNDEAHHVWDESGHIRFEEHAKANIAAGGEGATEMAWIRSIRRLHELGGGKTGRVGLQVDLSATLFEEAGAAKKPGKKAAVTSFKPADLFRHTVVEYPLPEAIRDGIVKRPVLERVVVTDHKTGQVEALVRDGQPNAWEKYRHLLVTGIARWKKVRDQLRAEGDRRKPILFVLCDDKNDAHEVANYLTYGQASTETFTGPPTGYRDPTAPDEPPLFVEDGRSTVIEIHIGQKEDSNEQEWERIRRAVNEVDRDEVPDGRGGLMPNPYNVVVSVMMLKEGWDVRNVKVIVPLRPCDSRTLTEQTLGRGLRKMHPPVLDDEGAAFLQPEDLYVIEHPSFRAVIDQIGDIVTVQDGDDIVHRPEYLPIRPLADEAERRARDVRLLRYAGQRAVSADWRAKFDVDALAPLRLAWMEEIPETEVRTWLKAALARGEAEGQHFVYPSGQSYRDFDHIVETAYAAPMLRELRASFAHKNAVKGVVREFLERRTFKLPMGVPLSFEAVVRQGHGAIALANLARPEVMDGARKALLPAVSEAIQAERGRLEPILIERRAAEIPAYQALKAHVLPGPKRTTFDGAALANEDERRVAVLFDRAADVTGWVYNHRAGVGYGLEYAWQGFSSQYFPDFVVRARLGAMHHNLIVEVKGRLDDRDKAKARRGQEYAALLAQHDPKREPWHYVMLVENPDLQRADITWWEAQSRTLVADLLARHEALPLVPSDLLDTSRAFEIVPEVPAAARFKEAAPVLTMAAAAGIADGTQTVEGEPPLGWAWLPRARKHDPRLFVARIEGRSMEPGVPDGSWCLFRAFPPGEAPAPTALDGRRVVVQIGEATLADAEYLFKRWRVAEVEMDANGVPSVVRVELASENRAFAPRSLTSADGEVRVVAEFLDVLA